MTTDRPTPSDPKCDKCGLELTTGAMAAFCPQAMQCEFWPHSDGSSSQDGAELLIAKMWINNACEQIGLQIADRERLERELAEALDQLLGIKEYREKNPLGGPAKVFDAMADSIRAGDDFNKVIADYGWCPVDRAENAEAALAESERKCERLRAQMKQMEKESREDLRSAAAEASWAERFPDEPYGTY